MGCSNSRLSDVAAGKGQAPSKPAETPVDASSQPHPISQAAPQPQGTPSQAQPDSNAPVPISDRKPCTQAPSSGITVTAEQIPQSQPQPAPAATALHPVKPVVTAEMYNQGYCSLELLDGRQVFGPWLKYHSYDTASHTYTLTVLVLATQSAVPDPPGLQYRHTPAQQPMATTDETTEMGAEVEVQPMLLYTWRKYNFWRYTFVLTCGEAASTVTYKVLLPPSVSGPSTAPRLFHVPSASQAWHWAFYSCNGFHDADNARELNGIQPLWRDVMARHSKEPFHLMVGGGDQLYNDQAFMGPVINNWDLKPLGKAQVTAAMHEPFTAAMQDEGEEFYFSHYALHWSQDVFCDALASIPSLMTWDDHCIFDGWGSYPDEVMQSPIMSGMYQAARLFYLLFQQHTTDALKRKDGYLGGGSEASWLAHLGPSLVIVGFDTRSERTLQRVIHPDGYRQMLGLLQGLPPSVQHCLVLTGVPLMYPQLPEITDATIEMLKVLDGLVSVKGISSLLQKTGLAARLQGRFGHASGLDDMQDRWDTPNHVVERDRIVADLMALAERKGMRVTLLGGDVHYAAVGQYCSRPGGTPLGQQTVPAMQDPKHITQVISSAIANKPPSAMVLGLLKRAGLVAQEVGQDAQSLMVPLFGPPGEGDSILKGLRNWCEVRQTAALQGQARQPQGQGQGAGGGGEDSTPVVKEAGHEGLGGLTFCLRVEREMGKGEVEEYRVHVPPLTVE